MLSRLRTRTAQTREREMKAAPCQGPEIFASSPPSPSHGDLTGNPVLKSSLLQATGPGTWLEQMGYWSSGAHAVFPRFWSLSQRAGQH